MSKYLNEEVVVQTRQGQPLWLRRDGRRLRVVEVAERWREVGYWWEGEAEKEFFLLEVSDAGRGGGRAYLLYREASSGKWFLYQVFD